MNFMPTLIARGDTIQWNHGLLCPSKRLLSFIIAFASAPKIDQIDLKVELG